MVGKNNKFLKENKNNQRFLRFSLRKLSVGVVSVAIAAGFYVGGSQSVLADTTSTDPVVSQSTSNDNLAESTDKNTVNLQNSSTSTDPSAVASAADSTAAEAGKSAVPAAEQQKTATFNVAEEKPVAALNTANLLDNKAQSSAAPDAATVNDDDLLKNIKISNPTDPKFIQYQDLVDSYMSDHYGEEKPSQYVFSVISDSRIDTDFIWTVDKDTGKKVSVYFNDWYRGITGYHQFIDADFDDNHNDYRYSNSGVTLSYDKSEGSSGSVSVVDDNHDILDLGDANLQDVYEINGNTDNSRSDSFAITLPEKGQPIIKFLYRNPDTGKLMDLRAPIYYSNGLTGQKFELDIGDSYKQELKDMFAGFKLVGSSKASGTFTQFAQGKTYVEHDASDDSEVIYQQIDAEGTMKVFYRGKDGEKQPVLDEYGNPCQLKAGSSIKIDTGNGIITAYNPFVTGDHAYELIYEPKYRNQVVNYVDHGKVIKSDTITGKITQTVDVTPSVPDHYELVPGQNIPSEVTLKDKNTPIIVKVQPKMDDITDPSQLTKAISRTITINVPHQTPIVENQSANFTRTGQHNEVTGEDVYTGWTLKDNTLEAVDAPAVPGYTPNVAHVDGVKNPTADTKLNDVVINYTADDRNQVVNYVDPNGKVVKTDTVKGKTDETVKVTPNVPDHYELVPGQNIPSEVTLKDKNTPIIVKVQPKMDDITDPSQLTKAISRTITINVPHQTPIVEKQSANFTRTGQHNEVTGEDVYTGWTLKDNTLEAVDAPAVPGYTPNVAHVDGVKNPTADTKLNDVVINYTADDRNQVVNYVDPNGKVVKTDTVKGKTDETVKVTPNVPDHYELVPGQNIPSEVTLKDKNTPIIVKVQPKMDDITDPSQLTKAISRTITINVPHQTPIVENQSANFTRTGQHNEVTGEDVYTGWTLKDNSLRHVDVPAIPGYTPSQNTVDGIATPAVDTPVSDITVNYKANEQTGQITYVDEKGNQISSTPLTGKTDEDIAINPVAPAGWELVPGQKYPATVTATADGIPGVTLTVRHHMINVVPGDVPTPGDKKTGNNDKKPGDGTPNKDITHEDLNKTITRTFIVKAPTGTMTKTQHISYQRTATIDDVTGDVTFSDWNTDGASFKAEVIPAISGYTSHVTEGNYGAYAPSQDQINNWTDPMITVTYTANDQSQVINYVDDHNKTIKTDTVKGKTDETVKVTPNVPDHYELVPGQNIPSEVTLKDKNTPIIVKVQPKMDDITDPSQLTKAISRTITINVPHQTPIVENQSANFTRTGQHNEVTGEDVYTGWTLKDNTLEAVDAPAVPGYTPNVAHVDGVKNPTADTKLNDVVINYTADDRNQVVNYVDPNGKVVKTDTVKGKTDETVKVTPNVPDHYELVPGQNIPSEVTLKDKNTPIIVKVQPKMDDITDPSQLTKAISRTITINVPHQTPIVENQSANFTRTGQHNEVTGKDVYTGWTLKDNTLEAVDAPAVPGYTPNVAHVDGVKNPTADTKLNDVVINYTADDRNQVVNYVDPNGKVVKTDTVKGKTDETVKVTPNVPDHYELVPGQNIPSEVTLKDKNTPIIVKVQPKMDDITDPSQLTKAISRTITINVPHQTPIVENQSANFTRTGQHNEVTGEDVYTGWTLKDNTLEAVDAPAVPGYTPNVAHVDGVKNPTADTKLNDVVINYTADDRNQVVNYVDPNGKVVKTDTVKGKTDETVKVTPNVPDHYELVPGQNIPSEVTLKDKNTPIIVKVQPKMDDITDPSQLTKAISRTITINVPHQTPIVENQSANFTRTGQHNEVTGKDVYTGWTLKDNTLEAVDAPAVPGYTPNVAHVDGVKNPTADTKLNDVVINYTADDRNQVVNYVDPNGKVVKTDTVKGKTDETVKVTPNVPDHYELVPGQNIPSEVTLKDKNTPIIVKVQPKMDDITDPSQLTKAISRTITINVPHQTPIVENQSANFTRTGQHNEVTGKDVYTGWTLKDNTLEAVDAPAVPGYTPNVAHVDGVKNPTADTKLNDVVINYTADDRNQVVNYVDPNGKVVKTDTVKGKTDETVKVTPNVPDHYELVPGQNIPSEVTLKDKNTPIIVKVQPKMDDITDPSQLTKAISRTITINVPHQTPIVENQSANFTRTGQHNEVTGKDVYTGWTLKDNTLEAVDAPAVPGYTPNVAHVDGVKNPTADTKLNDVVINYTADDRNQVVNYVDPNGKVVKTDTVKGKTDETVKVTPNVPDHYELVPGQNIPSEVTLKDKNTPIIVKVQPKMDDITDPSQLTKAISRTITINVPHQTPIVENQSANFTRTGQHNEVTGKDVYTGWTLKDNTLEAVDAPAVPGYTPNVAHVDGVKNPTADTKLNDVVINYTADDRNQVVNYVDPNGKVVKTDTVKGKTDETVKVTPNVPDHYELVPGQNIPSEVTLKDKNTPIIVKVQPKMDDITDPSQLTKAISRTITINVPHQTPIVENQSANFTRTGQHNEVTGEDVYTGWTLKDNTLEAVDAPAVPGYTPNVAHVDGVKNPTADTKLNDVVINYTADDRNQVVNYVDPNGKVVKTDTVKGKTDETVKVTPNVPDHYELVPGQNIPSEVTLKDKNTPIIVKVQPKMDDITDPSQLTKAISRTITINVPHQTPIVEKQSANFTRTGQHNEVTGEDVYTGWTLKDNSLRHVDVPAIPGYTPSQNTVDGIATPAVDTPVSDITVNYKANEQTGQITYVDEKGNQISSTPLTGKTDEDIAINPVAPAGWELVPGQKYPATVTATADGIPGVTLTVRHHMINVVPGDVPTPGDKKTGNNDKKPGDGTPNKDITHEDLNKTITRTFIVKAPTGTMTKTQHISYQRTATIDDVTGDVTFSDWNTDGASFKAEVIPAISGYTSHVTEGNYGAYAPSQDQINNWTDPMITVTYTANDQSQVINYVDDHNKTIKTDTVKGKTDETVKVTPNVPDHYELVPGQNIPSEVTLKDKNTPIIVKVQPKMDDITDPSQLTKAISRTITINVPHQTPIVENQSANFTRTGQHNEVTGEDVYTGWTLKDNTLEAVDAPAVPGYTPNVAHVDGVKNPTADTKLNDVVINYTADDRNQVVNYVDPNGKVVKTDTVKGKTDETVKVTPNVPDHYELVPGQNIPSEVTLKDKNTPIIVKVQPKMDDITDPSQLTKAISRTITINVPHQTPIVENQSANFTRTGQHNEVTGEDVYTGWTLKDNTLEAVDAPAVPGYTPNVAHVDGVKNPTADTKLNDVVINYTADDRNQVVNYVDPNGKVVKTDTVKGKTDETVKVTPNVPDHYELVPGQNIPSEVTLKDKNTPIIVKVQPKVDSITDPAKLNKSISRTITINKPGEKPQVINQTATFKRTGKTNEVTGITTYTPWVLDQNGLTTVSAPEVPGYTPSQKTVASVDNPTTNTKLTDVTINYTANSQTTHINYVDKDGETVKSDTVSGKTDETVKTNSEVPAGWKITDGQIPETIHFTGEETPDTTITIEHDTTSVDHIKPVKPGDKTPSGKVIDGAHESDLNQTITRTINVTTPDGQTTTTKQVAKIFRDATIDDVTGEVTYGSWSEDTWADFKPGQLAGYTASQADVPAVTVDSETTDQTVDITYAAVATPAQPEHQAPTASDTPDAQQATNQKADSNAQPAVTVVTSQQTATAQQAESTTNSRRLPQTGNSHDASALAGLGLASLMGLFGLGGKRRKRD